MSYINILLTLPYLAICALVIISPWNGFIFNISKDGDYIRGNGIYILYGYAALYLLISLFILIKYNNFFRKGYFLSLLSMYPFVIAGVVVQLINSAYLIESTLKSQLFKLFKRYKVHHFSSPFFWI